MIDHYDWAGGREAMLRFGPANGPVVVAAMPLLEEWNRTRAFTVTLLRTLAARGIASVLPDLPGHGESAAAGGQLTIASMAEALEAVTNRLLAERRAVLGVGIRGGALLDGRARLLGRWHLSPASGAELLSDLHKVRLAGGGMPDADGTMTVAGTRLSADFLQSLELAEPFDDLAMPRRVVRLATDPRPADRHMPGVPLWRRAESGNDPALVVALADDIADWTETCAA